MGSGPVIETALAWLGAFGFSLDAHQTTVWNRYKIVVVSDRTT